MNFAHLHLMLNHLPVVGTVFALTILVIGLMVRTRAVVFVGLAAFVLTALAAIPVYLTGEPAEEVVERIPGIAESVISQHESAALVSLVLAIICGLAAATALVSRDRSVRVPGTMVVVTIVIGLLTATSMAWTANLGGEIRHTEIRPAAAQTQPAGGEHRIKDDDD